MDDELAAQFARMGAVVEVQAPPAADGFEVLLANADAIAAWVACETQWRIATGPAGIQWLGLDYPAVDVVLRRGRFEDADTVFADLMVMEGAALDVLWETAR
ncbi:DUF1799 domain-containing protein [Paracoccus sp. 22332]|uniref:DUF1799 domain-containing protein n=1 Tax=Paracoccus sp. 22332 TaxID=3453913 RepID=UPI003F832987